MRQTVRHPELAYPSRAPHRLMTKEFLPKLTHKMSITDESQMRINLGCQNEHAPSSDTKKLVCPQQTAPQVTKNNPDKAEDQPYMIMEHAHTCPSLRHRASTSGYGPQAGTHCRHSVSKKKTHTQKPQCTPDSPRCQGPPPQASSGGIYMYIYIYINTKIYHICTHILIIYR